MTASYWQRDADWQDRWATTALPGRVEYVIVGAGFAGLMTAIRLRELAPDATIAVLDAERVGFGASGRNAGFLSPLAAPVWLLGAERSPEQAWAAARINAEVHDVARWIAEHVSDCELQRATLALQATGRMAGGALRELTRAVRLVGLEHRLLASRAHRGGLYLEMAAYTLHPYKLARGLAAYAERAGITIRERARVRTVEMTLTGARVHLADGDPIEARRVIVCTNAYTSSLDAGDTAGGFVVHSFMTATAPLDDVTRRLLVRDGDFTVELNPTQAYHRMHRDRIIYGGIDRLRAPAGGDFAVPAAERARLAAAMKDSFGRELPIEQAWSGAFHTTTTGLPIIRTSMINFGVIFNVGYGGTGVALALTCARLVARVAVSGLFASTDDARLLAVIHATRISVRDSMRAVSRIARQVAQPWRAP